MYTKSALTLKPGSVEQVLKDLLMSLPPDLNMSLSQISKDSGIDFYKYKKGGSIPCISSLVAGFTAMNRSPDWAFLLACNVVRGNLTFDEARSVLRNWHVCKGYAEGRIEEVLMRMVEMSGEE